MEKTVEKTAAKTEVALVQLAVSPHGALYGLDAEGAVWRYSDVRPGVSDSLDWTGVWFRLHMQRG